MIGALRALKRDLTSSLGRFEWIQAMVRNVPGQFGFAVRRWCLSRYFRAAGDGLMIHPGARILGPHRLTVGQDCHIGVDNTIQANGEVVMGDNVILGPGVKIWSVNHVFARTDLPIWDQGYEHKKVTIGHGVWLGADCFVMPGANIGDHVVVSAGSVVGGKDVEPYAIIAGNPARKIGSRRDPTAIARPAAQAGQGG